MTSLDERGWGSTAMILLAGAEGLKVACLPGGLGDHGSKSYANQHKVAGGSNLSYIMLNV